MFFGPSPKTNAVSLTRLIVKSTTYGSRTRLLRLPRGLEASRPSRPSDRNTLVPRALRLNHTFDRRYARRYTWGAGPPVGYPEVFRRRATSLSRFRLANLETSTMVRANQSSVSRACAASAKRSFGVPHSVVLKINRVFLFTFRAKLKQ